MRLHSQPNESAGDNHCGGSISILYDLLDCFFDQRLIRRILM